jgi:hypothetical protein
MKRQIIFFKDSGDVVCDRGKNNLNFNNYILREIVLYT